MADILLEAGSHDELVARLAALDIEVPERGNGRTTSQVERYGIVQLLGTLAPERLAFPLTLTHDDRPDFRLTMPSDEVGIEHTEAVPPNVASADAMRGRGLGPEVYFTPRALPGEPTKSRGRSAARDCCG